MPQTQQIEHTSPLELVRIGEDKVLFVFDSGFIDHEAGQTRSEHRKIEERTAERARALAYVVGTVAEEFGIAQRTRINPDKFPEVVELLGRGTLANRLIIEFHPDEQRRRSFPGLQVLGAAIAEEIGKVDELRSISDEEPPFWATDFIGDSPDRTRISY